MRRRAFTLTEVVVAILILGIMAAAITLSPNSAKQTAKMEAERIAAVISGLIDSAERTHGRFWFIPSSNEIYIAHTKEYYSSTPKEKLDFKVSGGCSFSSSSIMGYNTEGSTTSNVIINTASTPVVRIEVSGQTDDDAKYTITVTGAGTSPYFVHVFAE